MFPNTSFTNYSVSINITNIDTNFDKLYISVIQKNK